MDVDYWYIRGDFTGIMVHASGSAVQRFFEKYVSQLEGRIREGVWLLQTPQGDVCGMEEDV